FLRRWRRYSSRFFLRRRWLVAFRWSPSFVEEGVERNGRTGARNARDSFLPRFDPGGPGFPPLTTKKSLPRISLIANGEEMPPTNPPPTTKRCPRRTAPLPT